jgi:hypothetical protein
MHGSCSFEVGMDSKLHHNNVSKESFRPRSVNLGQS